jgi:signal transduction histidine kinase
VTGEYFSAYSIKVHKKLSQNLPPVPDYRLKMVFNNIIKNAYTAMGKKGGNLTITTALKSDCIEITFADTGPGIPEDIQNKIFEPFFTTKKIGEGSGLGLAICYEAIQRYKGTIRVESKVNKGATFIIQLPLPLEANSSHETLKLLEG